MSEYYPALFDLTEMTGRKSNENRTTVVANMEMKPRTKWVGILSFIVSVPFMGIGFMFLGFYALFVPIAFILAGHFFFNARTQSGLQRRTYETLLDRRRSGDNQFYLCWSPVEVGQSHFGRIRRAVAAPKTGTIDGKDKA